MLHFIYIGFISIIKLCYGFKVLISNNLFVKNFPFDHFAILIGKLLYCWKSKCQAGFLGLVETFFILDSILEIGNKPKVFTPLIGKSVKFIVGGRLSDNILA